MLRSFCANYSFFIFIFTLLGLGCSKSNSANDSGKEDRPNITDCSYFVEDYACDFSLTDQNGSLVSLYDFYGKTIILDFSAMWCGPCAMAASEITSVMNKFSNSDLVYLTVLIEDAYGNPPDKEDCLSWANSYGIDEPVLAGSRSLMDRSGEQGWPITSWPTFFFITDDMKIHSTLSGFSSHYIDLLTSDAIEKSSSN